MAEQPVSGQPFDDGPDDDAVVEGTVVPFPGPPLAPGKAAARRAARRAARHHPAAPAHLAGHRQGAALALAPRPPSRPVPRGQVAQAARPHGRVGARRRRPDRVRAARLVVGQRAGVPPPRGRRDERPAEVAEPAQARPRGPPRARLRPRRRGPRPGARRRGGDLVPAGAVAAHRRSWPSRCWRGSGGPRTSRS